MMARAPTASSSASLRRRTSSTSACSTAVARVGSRLSCVGSSGSSRTASVYNIRVMNLSLGAPVTLSYRTDPLSAAVEIAWQRGIVVVAASGNSGPQRDTVVSPGIDPYVITVGATDDLGTATRGDDVLAFFSAWGTADSNAKPDLVAPGRRIVSLRAVGSALDTALRRPRRDRGETERRTSA